MNHDEMRRTRGIAIRREGEHDGSQRGEKTKTKHHDEEKKEHVGGLSVAGSRRVKRPRQLQRSAGVVDLETVLLRYQRARLAMHCASLSHSPTLPH